MKHLRGLLVLLSVSAFAEAGSLRTALDRADELVRSGHASDALALLQKTVVEYPDALEAHLRYQDLGDARQLRRTYRARSKAQPKGGEALFLYARLVDGRRAIPLYRRVFKLAPGLVAARVSYARLLLAQGRTKEALKAAEKAVELGPEVADAHEVRATMLETKEAEAGYRRALAIDEHHIHARIQLAQLLAADDRAKEARVHVEIARKRAPGDPRVAIMVGLVLRTMGENAEAAKALRDAATDLPEDALAHLLLAGALLDLGELDAARAAATRARKLAPKMAAAHATAARVLLTRKQLALAIAAARTAVRLEPREGSHEFLLALCLEASGKIRDAVKHHKLAVRKEPDEVSYLLALGDAQDVRGRPRDALRAYRAASKREPEDADVWTRLGHLAADAGRGKESARAFRRAIQLAPKEIDLWKALGIVYQVELGKSNQAEECYRIYLAKGGDDKRVEEWLNRKS